MGHDDEAEIAAGLREQRQDAWRALYDRHAERVWRLVARRVGPSHADVADVVQETFLAAARSAASYDPARGSLWAWLSGVAHRQAALHYRTKRRHARVNDPDAPAAGERRRIAERQQDQQPRPSSDLERAETAELVRAALCELTDGYAAVLCARYLDGETVDTIATAHRCSAEAMRSRLARARREFRRVYARLDPDRRAVETMTDPPS